MNTIKTTIQDKDYYLDKEKVELLREGKVALKNCNYPNRSPIMDAILSAAFDNVTLNERRVFGYYYRFSKNSYKYAGTDYNPCIEIQEASWFFTQSEPVEEVQPDCRQVMEQMAAALRETVSELESTCKSFGKVTGVSNEFTDSILTTMPALNKANAALNTYNQFINK